MRFTLRLLAAALGQCIRVRCSAAGNGASFLRK